MSSLHNGGLQRSAQREPADQPNALTVAPRASSFIGWLKGLTEKGIVPKVVDSVDMLQPVVIETPEIRLSISGAVVTHSAEFDPTQAIDLARITAESARDMAKSQADEARARMEHELNLVRARAQNAS